MDTRAGIVALAGRPNAGKSTLLNRLIGEHLAITSSKPQSTRERVVGLLSDANTQIILFDTPGLLDPAYALQRSMRASALRALREADLIVFVSDANDPVMESLTTAAQLASPPAAPVFRALNKCDTLSSRRRDTLRAMLRESDTYADAMLISARTGEGIVELLARVRAVLPVSPFLFPAQDLSAQHLRFFVREMIREAASEVLSEELPYSVACAVEEYREDATPVYIRAILYVERESQKGIVIGAGGERIRAIGMRARSKMEGLVGGQLFLDLQVRVLKNWRRDPAALARLGYPLDDEATAKVAPHDTRR